MNITQNNIRSHIKNTAPRTVDFRVKYKTEVNKIISRNVDTGNNKDFVLLVKQYASYHF